MYHTNYMFFVVYIYSKKAKKKWKILNKCNTPASRRPPSFCIAHKVANSFDFWLTIEKLYFTFYIFFYFRSKCLFSVMIFGINSIKILHLKTNISTIILIAEYFARLSVCLFSCHDLSFCLTSIIPIQNVFFFFFFYLYAF